MRLQYLNRYAVFAAFGQLQRINSRFSLAYRALGIVAMI